MQVKTKNLVVAGLAVLMVGLLWYRVVYSPMESKASKDRSEAHDANVSADNLRQALSGATNSKKPKSKDVKTDVMLGAVPQDGAEASFLRSIDLLRASSGADWQSVTNSTPTSAGTYSSITVGITVEGTEDQLARYLAGLASMKRIFVLDNVTTTTGSDSTGVGSGGSLFASPKLQMQLSGRIFSQPGAVAVPNGTTGTTGTATPAATPATVAPSAPPGTQNS